MTEITPSAVDEARFGVRVHRGRAERVEDVPVLLQAARTAGTELLMLRVPTASLEAAQALLAEGFLLADTLVYYAGSTRAFDPEAFRTAQQARSDGMHIRRAGPADAAGLEATARAAFTNFRGHYHKDPRLDGHAATEGYVEWCLTALDRDDWWVYVAHFGDEVAGFVTVHGDEIVLNGVAPSHQRKGIYAALVDQVGCALREAGTESIRSSTQIDNLGPQRVWVRRGLKPYDSCYTLHGWF